MIKVTKLELSMYDGYVERGTIYLNPSNLVSVETSTTDEDNIHIRMINGDEITTRRVSLDRIIESFYR